MAMDLKEIKKYIKEAMPDAVIDIQDLAGDGNHYSATITSSQFAGKSKIEQHKMVYNSLKGKMGNELHWPTIPQLYIKKEFIGGCDIIKEMYESGELKKVCDDKGINYKK